MTATAHYTTRHTLPVELDHHRLSDGTVISAFATVDLRVERWHVDAVDVTVLDERGNEIELTDAQLDELFETITDKVIYT